MHDIHAKGTDWIRPLGGWIVCSSLANGKLACTKRDAMQSLTTMAHSIFTIAFWPKNGNDALTYPEKTNRHFRMEPDFWMMNEPMIARCYNNVSASKKHRHIAALTWYINILQFEHSITFMAARSLMQHGANLSDCFNISTQVMPSAVECMTDATATWKSTTPD